MKKATAVIASIAVAALAGCGPAHSSHSVSPSARASVSALASVPGADAKAILIKAGVPLNGTSDQQLAFAKDMLVKANRQVLADKLKIPPQNRAAFEARLLDAAKADHVITSHGGRRKFLDQDLPNLLAVYA